MVRGSSPALTPSTRFGHRHRVDLHQHVVDQLHGGLLPSDGPTRNRRAAAQRPEQVLAFVEHGALATRDHRQIAGLRPAVPPLTGASSMAMRAPPAARRRSRGRRTDRWSPCRARCGRRARRSTTPSRSEDHRFGLRRRLDDDDGRTPSTRHRGHRFAMSRTTSEPPG